MVDPIKDSKKKIKMKTGEGASFDKLKSCFFYPVSDANGVYLLCNEFDVTLTVVTNNQPFMFEHDGLIWKVPNPQPGSEPFSIDNQVAKGSWWNNDPTKTNDDTGTFSAQTSGTGDPGDDEGASYAAAN